MGRCGEVAGSGARRGGGDLTCALAVLRLLAGFRDAEVAVMNEEFAAFKNGVGSTRRNRWLRGRGWAGGADAVGWEIASS